MTYGDLDFTKNLRFINEEALAGYKKKEVTSEITLVTPWKISQTLEQKFQPENSKIEHSSQAKFAI